MDRDNAATRIVAAVLRFFEEHRRTNTHAAWKALSILRTNRTPLPPLALEEYDAYYRSLRGRHGDSTDVSRIPASITRRCTWVADPPSISEVAAASRKLRVNKAVGPDSVPNAFLRIPEVQEKVTEFFRESYTHTPPAQWLRSETQLLYKKGNRMDLGNYRQIVLSSCCGKLYNAVLRDRIRQALGDQIGQQNSVLLPTQNGGRPGRGTAEHVLCLRSTIQQVKAEKSGAAFIIFVDFSSAFDCVFWTALEKLLGAYGMPESLRSSIIATYRGATTQVRTPQGLTEAIELIAGVLQGDTLAPTLFNLVINAIMREIEGVNDPDVGICFGPTRGHLHVRLKHLEFVDDIVLLSRTAAAAEKLLRKLVVSAQKYGLKVNYGTGKTEVIVLGSPVPRSVKRPDGVYLREVHDYKYLGSMLMSCREDFLRNKNLAWQVIHRLKSVWRSTLRLDLKALLFKALVVPVYLSGAETWFVGTDLLADISGTYTCMVRYVRGVKVFSRDTRVTNSDLFGSHFASRGLKLCCRRDAYVSPVTARGQSSQLRGS